ncbi:coiled-coil and C2 domain-containing protein 1-like, partial [Eurytemora carolleeae]|uniref:coiled-coil and C2 domain-containing protein 1-like n=1 Tax=Eurytemora carolleeae TaxID=1294199 RepID=UPI000C76B7AB
MDVAGVDEMGNLDDMLEGDDDLEAELAALVSGGGGQTRRPKPRRVPDLDSMVADCMKDYDSHEEFSDTEDPDLLAELHGLDDVTEEVATVHP